MTNQVRIQNTSKDIENHLDKVSQFSPVLASRALKQIEVTTQTSVLIVGFNEELQLKDDTPLTGPKGYEVLVKNYYVGLNPIDWKGKKYGFGIYHFPWINGRESAGVVADVGEKVSNLKVGDEVIVCSTSYRENKTSTFQEYTLVDSRLVWKKPRTWDFKQASTIGVGLVTSGFILFRSFGIALDSYRQTNKPRILLIWGGATTVGIYLTQLARIYGIEVISIASESNVEYLQSFGSSLVIKRELALVEIEAQIKDYLKGREVDFAVDCVSKETAAQLVQILDNIHSPSNGSSKTQLAAIVGTPKTPSDAVVYKQVVIKEFHENIEFSQRFTKLTNEFLFQNKLTPIRQKVYSRGLSKIIDALRDLEKYGASAEKYVVEVA